MRLVIIFRWITLIAIQLMLLATCVVADNQSVTQTSEEKAVDPVETASIVRRLLRSACKRIMVMSTGEEIDTVRLDSAINETSAAQATWEKAIGGWGNIAPKDYKTHPTWESATGQIMNGINDMLKQEKSNAPDSAFFVCRSVAFQFVKLNEQSDVHLTSDVLFRFKATIKPLVGSIKSGNYEKMREKLPELKKLRNKALTSPVGGNGTIEEKEQSLQEFSDSFDVFTKKLDSGSADSTVKALTHLIQAVDRAFEACL